MTASPGKGFPHAPRASPVATAGGANNQLPWATRERAKKELDSLAATASKRRWDVGFDYSRGDLQDAVAIAQLVFSLSRVGVSDGRSEPCREAEAAEAESSKGKTAGGVFMPATRTSGLVWTQQTSGCLSGWVGEKATEGRGG